MKRFFTTLFCCLIALSCCAIPTSATSETSADPSPALWVVRPQNPSNMLIAKGYSLLFSKVAFSSDIHTNEPYFLGDPFALPMPTESGFPIPGSASSCFPILQDNKIIRLCRVYRVGAWGYGHTLEDNDLSNALNTFIGETSAQKPLFIYRDENNDLVLHSETKKVTIPTDYSAEERVVPSEKAYEDLGISAGSINIFAPATFVFGSLRLSLRPFCITLV